MSKKTNVEKIELEIQGMTCHSCTDDVTEELLEVKGVLKVDVPSWKLGRAEIQALSAVNNIELINAVEEAGYNAIIQKRQPVDS